MTPAVKYTLGRIGLFLVAFLALAPVDLNVFLKLMIAVLVSAAASYFLLKRWRDELSERVAGSVERRKAERARLRDALAGDEDDR